MSIALPQSQQSSNSSTHVSEQPSALAFVSCLAIVVALNIVTMGLLFHDLAAAEQTAMELHETHPGTVTFTGTGFVSKIPIPEPPQAMLHRLFVVMSILALVGCWAVGGKWLSSSDKQLGRLDS